MIDISILLKLIFREAILVNLATSLQFLLGEEVTLPLCIFSSVSDPDCGNLTMLVVSMGVLMMMDVKGCCCPLIIGPDDKCSFRKVVARMSGQDGLLLAEEQLWAAFRDAHKCFQVESCQICKIFSMSF